MTTLGACALCGEELPKNRMTKHLAACREGKPGSETWFHLIVQGLRAPQYWLHLELSPRAKLDDLDRFLRRTWLECCGHMSQFEIQGRRYVYGEKIDPEDRTMAVAASRVLRPGTAFKHEYDFGTTTQLGLRVVAERGAAAGKAKLRLLARNTPPRFACEGCGEPATELCTECSWEQPGWLCTRCGNQHEHGEDMLLPIVNSPRVGMCGYSG